MAGTDSDWRTGIESTWSSWWAPWRPIGWLFVDRLHRLVSQHSRSAHTRPSPASIEAHAVDPLRLGELALVEHLSRSLVAATQVPIDVTHPNGPGSRSKPPDSRPRNGGQLTPSHLPAKRSPSGRCGA
jgi:hypothetical protein